jgi:argininosuccinate lyase
MLAAQGIISAAESAAIIGGLKDIAGEIGSGTFPEDLAFEDIHMNIEKRLIENNRPGRRKTAHRTQS